jgi:hypothetical protein
MGTWKFIGKAAWVWAFSFAWGSFAGTMIGDGVFFDVASGAFIASSVTAVWAACVTCGEMQR